MNERHFHQAKIWETLSTSIIYVFFADSTFSFNWWGSTMNLLKTFAKNGNISKHTSHSAVSCHSGKVVVQLCCHGVDVKVFSQETEKCIFLIARIMTIPLLASVIHFYFKLAFYCPKMYLFVLDVLHLLFEF